MRRYSLLTIGAILLIALVWTGCNSSQGPVAPGTARMATKPVGIDRAMEVQDRHTDRLMGLPGVVGTAIGQGAEGGPVIKILTESRRVSGLPRDLEGIPVETEVTGKVVALAQIGTSTGNANECAAGTIGVRVKDRARKLYALSNNHVFARENKARTGEQIVSPGLYDTDPQCSFHPETVIGTLARFVRINFGGKGSKVDAAIALLSTTVSNTTPAGYTPSATEVPAFIGQAVKKHGRTTGETHGTVTGLNVTVRVEYRTGVATFRDQIQIGYEGFSAAGDSGSLIVTDDGNANPVGLLFAGTSTITFANRIQNVTSALGVTVDGTP